jgi:hypothetical protein
MEYHHLSNLLHRMLTHNLALLRVRLVEVVIQKAVGVKIDQNRYY